MSETKENFSTKLSIILVPNTTEGFFAALGIKKHLKKQGLAETVVVRVHPCQLGKISLADNLPIYIAALGNKNCNPKALNSFIEKFEGQIIFWADNHPDDDCIKKISDKGYYFHTSSNGHPSCLSFLEKIWGTSTVKEEWTDAANFLETKLGKANLIAETYKKLMYVAHTEDASGQKENLQEQIEDFYSGFLLSGTKEATGISFFVNQYDKIAANTKNAINNLNWSPDFPNQVLICRAEGQVDKDLLVAAANRLSGNYLLIIQHKSLSENPITTMIATRPELIPAKYQRNVATRVFIPGNNEEVLRGIYQSLIVPSFKINSIETQSATV
jgi:hypothetical protein